MSRPASRVYVSERVALAPGSLFPEQEVQRIRDLAEIPGDSAGVVAILDTAETARALANGQSHYPILLWHDNHAPPEPALLEHRRVVGTLNAHCGVEPIRATLRALSALSTRGEEVRSARMLERLLDIGRALASEKDLDILFALILSHARELTGADGASLYTREAGGGIYFRLWQNASHPHDDGVQRIPVGESSIASYVAHTGEMLVLDDVYSLPADVPYAFNAAFDREHDYRTQSLLTVPLKNKHGDTVGVLQLVNRKDHPQRVLRTPAEVARHVEPFSEQDRAIALALAGQAGVALENSLLYADIERLFEGFVRASVQAIESRDPTTAGHSFRVADFSERLAVAVDRADMPALRALTFSREQLRELRYASLLHDFGKVGVREHVLVKAKKLYPHQLELLNQRFRYARASLERRAYRALLALHDERGIGNDELAARRQGIEQALLHDLARLDDYLNRVLAANEPNVSHREAASLDDIAAFRFPGEDGEALPLLHDFEFGSLALTKGSLNDDERTQIESHVTHTYAFLSLIPWTRDLKDLPYIAHAHHEKLDGTGYPRKLAATDIPVQSRIMTIADIYDALTARDRPYKRSVPPERALDILHVEANAGKVDSGLLQVFHESGAWRL